MKFPDTNAGLGINHRSLTSFWGWSPLPYDEMNNGVDGPMSISDIFFGQVVPQVNQCLGEITFLD